jgi:predicted DNA-binding antitoxin AbrB/MazE fold protein
MVSVSSPPFAKDQAMPITVEATYENGVLRPHQPLPLKEHERVEIVIRTPAQIQAALEAVRRSYGLLGWTGDPETVRRLALDSDFGIEESP